jgi:hypothetical protein
LSELQKVYTAAKSLATRYFGEDLPDDVFKSAAFEDVRKDFKHLDIPLLASNSISAKKARMAAFLATLGSKLTARIFVPFYILPSENQDRPSEDIDDIAMMLSILSRHDRKKELHLRSVLLAISPSEQKAVAHGRGIDIAVEVSNEIGILVSGDQQLEFDQELRKFCDMAVESWECLRPLKDKVEPFDEDTSRHTEEYWLPAEFDIGTQQQKTNGLASKPSMHSLNASGPVVCVWPGFYLGGQVLRQGFMLLDSQVKPGADEQRPRQSLRALRRVSTGGLQHMRRHSTLKAKAS